MHRFCTNLVITGLVLLWSWAMQSLKKNKFHLCLYVGKVIMFILNEMFWLCCQVCSNMHWCHLWETRTNGNLNLSQICNCLKMFKHQTWRNYIYWKRYQSRAIFISSCIFSGWWILSGDCADSNQSNEKRWGI